MKAFVMAAGVSLSVAALFAAPQRPAATPWPSEGPPRPLPAREVKFPPYEVRTLENGLQVVAVLHHEQPVVSMRMLIRAGAASDPRAKLGLAMLAASLLDQGTTTKSAREVNDEIDFIGAAMGAGAGTDLTYANLVVMKDSLETGLRMLSDTMRHPAFAPDEIERQRQQAMSGKPRGDRDRGVRAARLRVSSLRPASKRHTRDARLDHAGRPAGVPPEEFRPEQRDSGHRGRCHY
ncbi:MAG: hypothetical protein DMF90_14885 [Acidobacteria bacterium]|nr:MAG: hypothetical protein DMF90_14885 [Acidobacteriota bacterium]